MRNWIDNIIHTQCTCLSMAAVVMAVLVGFASSAMAQGGHQELLRVGMLDSRAELLGSKTNSFRKGLLLAVDETNGGGGILGRRLDIVEEDSSLQPLVAAERARNLIVHRGARALFSGGVDPVVAAVADVCNRYGVVFVNMGTERRAFTGQDCKPYAFRTCLSVDMHVGALLLFFRRMGMHRYVVMSRTDAWGAESLESLLQQISRLHPEGKIVKQYSHSARGDQFIPIFQQAKEASPDVLVVTDSGPDLEEFVERAKQAGLDGKIGTLFLDDQDILRGVKEAAVGNWVAAHSMATMDTPHNRAFVEKYRQRYDGSVPGSLEANGYVALRFLAEAIRKAGTIRPADWVKSWEGLTWEGPNGPYRMRKEDHQAIFPVPVARIEAVSPLVDFPFMGRPTFIPGEEPALPSVEAGCRME